MPPSRGLSQYSSQHRYYNSHAVGGIENEQSAVIKKADSGASLHPVNQYATAPNTVSVPQPNNELLQFIEKQEGYIEQLERESQFCRVSHLGIFNRFPPIVNINLLIVEQGELGAVLSKVKDVISENKALTEQTKIGNAVSDSSDCGSNEYDYQSGSKDRYSKVHLSGPNIVFESRISELEAQLAQAEIDIKKLTQENSSNKQKLANGEGNESGANDIYRHQLDALQR